MVKEITKEQFLSYDDATKARILKEIVLGNVKYRGDTNE